MSCEDLSHLIKTLDSLLAGKSFDFEEISKTLMQITELIKCNSSKQDVVPQHWTVIWTVILKAAGIGKDILQNENLSSETLNFIINLLRCFRNCCAGCCHNEQLVINIKELLEIPFQILLILMEHRKGHKESETIALRCCLQIFGNVVCQNIASKSIVWTLFSEINLFSALVSDSDLKVQEYTMMILYHCMNSNNGNLLINSEKGQEILITLIDILTANFTDWGLLILESIICEQDFIMNCYHNLPTKDRLLVLDVIAEMLENQVRDKHKIPEITLKAIKEIFVEKGQDIFKTNDLINSGDLSPIEISKQLSVLCISSVDNEYNHVIKSYADLLEITIDILKSMHLLGKQSCSTFSAIPNLNNLSEEELENHPTYCFKKNLVRLIGNMCAENRSNQDLVRRNDGIPLLLDCCNLDVRNPFIMQWCILAIRNILENNQENQALLASISITSEQVNSPLLNELGFIVEMKEGKPFLRRQ